MDNENLQLNNEFTYSNYGVPPAATVIAPVVPGGIAPVVTIKGNSGAGASGPNVNFTGGATGYTFVAAGTDITLTVSSGATIRTAISAAKSGANADLNTFSALTGSSGWAAWTGTADKTTHATYPATVASAGYVQAEVQGLMDKVKQLSEMNKALLDTLLAWGGIKP